MDRGQKMIEIVTANDLKDILSDWQKFNERTKAHTIRMMRIEKEIEEIKKKLKGGINNGRISN